MFYSPLTDEILSSPREDTVPLREQGSNEPNTSINSDGFQFAWDTVSLNCIKKCPRYYQYTILEGWQLRLHPPALAFGIAFHTCLEQWDKLLALGLEKPIARLRITRLAGLLGETIPPGDNVRSKETLIRSVLWYTDQFDTDPAVTTTLSNGTPAVEYSFTLPFEEINSTQTYLCGHIDRIVLFEDQLWVTDRKTTKSQLDHRFLDQFKPNGQLKQYILAGHVLANEGTAIPEPPVGALIDGVQLGVTFTRFQRFPVIYSAAEIDEYINDTRTWIEFAYMLAERRYARPITSGDYPMNETACTMYGGCVFQEICRQSPLHRQRYLEAHFRKKTWDPLQAR